MSFTARVVGFRRSWSQQVITVPSTRHPIRKRHGVRAMCLCGTAKRFELFWGCVPGHADGVADLLDLHWGVGVGGQEAGQIEFASSVDLQ